MPITQDRMIDLIEASSNLYNSYKTLIIVAREIINEGADTTALFNLIEEYQPKMTDIEVIIREQAHFRARRKHNDYTREAMRRLRAQRPERTQDNNQADVPQIDKDELLFEISRGEFLTEREIAEKIEILFSITDMNQQIKIIRGMVKDGLLTPGTGPHNGQYMKADSSTTATITEAINLDDESE